MCFLRIMRGSHEEQLDYHNRIGDIVFLWMASGERKPGPMLWEDLVISGQMGSNPPAMAMLGEGERARCF